MATTVHVFYVTSMAERCHWCWTCERPSAALVPALTEDSGVPQGVAWLRACDGCGTRTILR